MSSPDSRKVPQKPPASFTIEPEHLRSFTKPLWRVFATAGEHPAQWDQLRHFGPIEDMRFDPHPLPRGFHPGVGVVYTASNPHTALAEVFQASRVIDRTERARAIASWTPTRPLQLLDLTSNWPVINGAAASMMMDNKANTQAWARAIDQRHGGPSFQFSAVPKLRFGDSFLESIGNVIPKLPGNAVIESAGNSGPGSLGSAFGESVGDAFRQLSSIPAHFDTSETWGRTWLRLYEAKNATPTSGTPAIDGLYHQSSINNEPLVTLFRRATFITAFPKRPSFYALLDDASADVIIYEAVRKLGYQPVKRA